MKPKNAILIVLTILVLRIDAQVRHLDYLGAGHSNKVSVTANSSAEEAPETTIDGFNITEADQLKHASRFLAHASFGVDMATIKHTAAMGYEAWFEEQFELPLVSYLDEMLKQNAVGGVGYGYGPNNPLTHRLFGTAWLTNNLTSPDILRQRMTFNLSQIFVINSNSDLFKKAGESEGYYYDLLQINSFNNYISTLTDVITII